MVVESRGGGGHDPPPPPWIRAWSRPAHLLTHDVGFLALGTKPDPQTPSLQVETQY